MSGIPAESVEEELRRILRSKAFSHSERLSQLLRFTIERALQGEADHLKEYVLGVEALQKGEGFDPRMDPAVRVEFHRLREKLKSYYDGEGRESRLRIEYPKGSYAPVFKVAALGRPKRLWLILTAAAVLTAAVVAWLALSRRAGTGKPPLTSIAVLPFANFSPEQDQDYFCDGMTDALINALAKVEGLRVVSRTSAFEFKRKAKDIRRIGEQLSVGSVLEGSVQRVGNKVRITAQLIKVADGYHLWSGTYAREMEDVFALQEEISQAIVNALRARLPGRLVAAQTGNLEAYNVYLKGRYHWNKRTEGDLRRSVEYFQQAIAADPHWAVSYAALSDSYVMLASYGAVAPKEAMPKAKKAAEKALAVDPALADAHAALGFVRSFYEWDWPGAEHAYQRAIELNPGYATARHWYSGCLRAMGRLEEAMTEIKRAQELDPLSVAIGRDLGRVYHLRRQYDQAIEQYRRVLELDPNFPSGYLHLGMAYEGKLRYEEALAAFQKAQTLPGGNPLILGASGHCYAASGNLAEARRALTELDELSRRRYVAPISRALIYIGLGDRDRAFQWLEKACEERDPWLAWLNVEPVFDSLRSDPRFPRLLRRVGLAGAR
jgi:serine/threonine-protein kinase